MTACYHGNCFSLGVGWQFFLRHKISGLILQTSLKYLCDTGTVVKEQFCLTGLTGALTVVQMRHFCVGQEVSTIPGKQ